jgi:hypothetical protein
MRSLVTLSCSLPVVGPDVLALNNGLPGIQQ